MVLSSATNEDSTFGSSDSDDAYKTTDSGAYPPYPPITTFLGLSSGSFSEAARKRFIELQLAIAEREFGFHPTPLEREGMAYYNAVFYSAESKGSLYGTLAGGAIGVLMTRRQRNVGFLFRGIGNRLGVQYKWQLLASKLTNFAFITAVGRLWGITSYGVQAFNQTTKMQREDPNMRRYLKARDAWLAERHTEGRSGITRAVIQVGQEARKAKEQEGADPQSLGGPDFYEDSKPADGSAQGETEDNGESRRRVMEAVVRTQRQREAEAEEKRARQQANERNNSDDDPFFGDSEPAQPNDTQAAKARRNPPYGSAWDRLRRGEHGGPSDRDDSTASEWPRRPAMKGFERSEEKEDSFSFSTGDRERAKEEAQRLFDERVERERHGEGRDGFAKEMDYNKGGRR